MKRRKYQSVYVPASPPRPSFWAWLRQLWQRPQTPRREPAPRVAIAQREWEPPSYIKAIQEDRRIALRLLGMRCSRREWERSRASQQSWARARRILQNAKVLSEDGEYLYGGRDAYLRLTTYMDEQEDKCRLNGMYVSP